jgi:hypothetical protein
MSLATTDDPKWWALLANLRLPSRATFAAVILGVILQRTIASVYARLIVELFAGSRTTSVSSGLEIRLSYMLTAVATAACALYCEKRSGPSRVLVVIQLVAVIIPLQALLAAHFEFARPEFAVAVALAYVGSLAFAGGMPEVQLQATSAAPRVLLLIFGIVVTAYVYAALLAGGGFGRISFDLTAVYDVREEFLEQIAPLIGYLVPWQGYVLNPALMLFGLKRRSLLIGLLGLVLQLLLFGMTGFRAFLFIPFLVLAFYFFGHGRRLLVMAIAGLLLVIGAALMLYVWLKNPLIPALLIDRVIVVPAEIHYWYYDFFGAHGQAPLQLSQSILSGLSTAHYSAPVPEVIGWKYLGSAASANVGLFGDAFANFGFAGCAIFALVFGLVLKVVDAAARDVEPRFAAALVAMPAFQLVNSGLLTTLLTHGLALAILILWAIRPSGVSAGRDPGASA